MCQKDEIFRPDPKDLAPASEMYRALTPQN